jgi:hypothetical protein
MRALRNLVVVVLVMAAASGCAGMQSRVAWPTHSSDEPDQSRLASWFKSRSLFRSASRSTNPAGEATDSREMETARRTTPETDIWPEQHPARLSRLFPWFGRRDVDRNQSSAGSLGSTAAVSARFDSYDERRLDGQVKPVGGEQSALAASAGVATTPVPGGNGAAASSTNLSDPVSSPSIKLYAPPQPEGDVALQVAPADLSQGDGSSATLNQHESIVGLKPRLEDPLVTAVGDTGSATSASDQPPSRTGSGPPPPIEPAPATNPAKPTAAPVQRIPSAKPATAPQPGSSPGSSLGPPPPITPAPAPAAVPTPAVTTPPPAPAVVPAAPASSAPPSQAAEHAPTAHPGPPPTNEPPAAAAGSPTSQQASPSAQANALVAPNVSQATAPAAGSLAPSPQAGIGCDSNKVKPAHKKCAILTWLHDLHSAKPPTCEPSCQLPPPAYPTSYVACLPAPRCDCPSKPGAVLATPQSAPGTAPCAGAAPKKSCFSWLHKGMLTEFVHNLKSWRCSCPCHNAPATLEHHGCKPCGGPAGSGKCSGIAYPWASPQASPAAPAPTGQAAQASLRAEPGNVAQEGQVPDRISAKSLDESSQR